MALIVQNRAVSVPSGGRSLLVENLPDGLSVAQITLKRCTAATPTLWPNVATVLGMSAFMSFDGGVNWQHVSGFAGSPGGIYTDRLGNELAATIWRFSLHPGVNRQIRFDIDVQNGPLVSEITVEAD